MAILNSIYFPQSLREQPVVIVPGLRNSDAQHWQTRWQENLPNSKRIELPEWNTADLAKWKQGIIRQLQNIDKPAVLIAHSFGALASASVAQEFPEKIAALFLVAPADPDKFHIAQQLPQQPLPVPTQIIASSNDPWLAEAKAAYWALLWGADYFRYKNVGHINSASNLGNWPEGITHLQRLLRKVKPNHHPRASKNKSQAA
jgi:uncharacterized protein